MRTGAPRACPHCLTTAGVAHPFKGAACSWSVTRSPLVGPPHVCPPLHASVQDMHLLPSAGFLKCDPAGPLILLQDLNGMVDAAKYADLVLLLVDASFGFEMETFEFLNILQVGWLLGLEYCSSRPRSEACQASKELSPHSAAVIALS